MENTPIQIRLTNRFVIRPGIKLIISRKLTERCSLRKKEKVNETEISRISQQKIIHLGAKFFKKRIGIIFQFNCRDWDNYL